MSEQDRNLEGPFTFVYLFRRNALKARWFCTVVKAVGGFVLPRHGDTSHLELLLPAPKMWVVE